MLYRRKPTLPRIIVTRLIINYGSNVLLLSLIHISADVCAVVGQLADGVHRVVTADVEAVADVQLLQDLKQLDLDGLALGGVPVGQLVARCV